jgi:hypothetical protein
MGRLGPKTTDDLPLRAAYRRPWFSPWVRVALYGGLAVALFAYGFYYAATAPFLMTPMLVPQVILAALIIWALPSGDYAPVGTLPPLFFMFFAALMLWPNYLAIALPGLPWVTLTRVFGVPLTILLLICISVSHSFRISLKNVMGADPLVWQSLLLFVILQTISLPFSDLISISVSRYILAQTNWTAIFVVSCYIFSRPRALDIWAKALLFLSFAICLIAVWEFKLGYVPWAGHIPSFLKIEDDAVLRSLAGARRSASGVYRVQSTATTPLGLAEILGLAAPFALHFGISKHSPYLRIFSLFCLPLFVAVIVLTDSRLGIVSCLVGLAFYLLVWALVRWRQVKDSVFAPGIVFAYPAILSMMIAATFFVGKLRAKVWGNGTQAASTESRKIQWQMGIPKILDHPLGHGVARSGHALGFKGPNGIITVDSYYLTVLLEVGILGFIVYFFFFIRAAWVGVRAVVSGPQDREMLLLIPLCVAVGEFVIVKSVFSQDANHPAMFMMVGGIIALVHRANLEKAAAQTALKAGL